MKKKMLANRLNAIRDTQTVVSIMPGRKESSINDRSEVRETVFKFGTVIFSSNRCFDCIILDMHKHGARIRLRGAPDLPQSLVLSIPGLGLRSQAEVIWRRGEETGLRLIS